MNVFDVQTMCKLDEAAIENDLIPGKILMERAGCEAGKVIIDYLKNIEPSLIRRILIVCGSGNNGGDGFVISRYLTGRCDDEIVVYTMDGTTHMKSSDAAFHASLIPESVTVDDVQNYNPQFGDVTVDCLLGTGFNGPLKESYRTIIQKINSSAGRIISIDIPSGLNGNDGTFDDCAVKADLTVSIAYPKIGLFKNDGPSYSGVLKNVDIGIRDRNNESLLDAVFMDDIRAMMPDISLDTHKNRRGTVLAVGGSELYGGAIFLSAISALRAGAGLCRVVTPDDRVTNHELSLIIRHIKGNNGCFTEHDLEQISNDIQHADSIVLGPGIGSDGRSVKFVSRMLMLDKKMVVDADALNAVSVDPSIWRTGGIRVLTPHPGEMKRLLTAFGLEEYQHEERPVQALKLAEVTDSVVVLKGFRTVIAAADGRFRVNTSGNSNLATAGSGDCLAGVAAAFLNHFEYAYDAATAAVFVHGLAGELSPHGCGTIGDDLPELIAKACRMVRR
jgi:NAD(P)H-hydrate epimerase